jgi:RHS repeat-associated protein
MVQRMSTIPEPWSCRPGLRTGRVPFCLSDRLTLIEIAVYFGPVTSPSPSRNRGVSNELPFVYDGWKDDETDLLYYGYRYYNASTGRWITRDPVGEKEGLNLNAFLNNRPVAARDEEHGATESGVTNLHLRTNLPRR